MTDPLRRLAALVAKELRLWARSPASVFFTLGWPLAIAFFFGLVFGGGGRQGPLPVAVVLEDAHPLAERLVASIERHPALAVRRLDRAAAEAELRRGRVAAAAILPPGFGARLAQSFRGEPATLRLLRDPARTGEALVLEGLLTEAGFRVAFASLAEPGSREEALAALRAGARELPGEPGLRLTEFLAALERLLSALPADAEGTAAAAGWPPRPLAIATEPFSAAGRRPPSAFAVSFVQAMFWALLGAMMSVLSELVRERITGTWERLRTTPASVAEILLGKGVATMALMIAALGVVALAGLPFGVRPEDPLKLLAAAAGGAIAFTGLTLVFGTAGESMQAVHGTTWAVMLPLAMVGGGMVPLMMLPEWLAGISDLSPVKWTILALEGAYWRGLGWSELAPVLGVLLLFGVVAAGLGIVRILRRP